jgi:hypothetical protein
MAVLGPPLPRNPQSRLFLAAKAGAACAIALMLDHLTGNPDHVTSTFVAVLSVSPVVLMGLRRSLDQVMGSFVGGIWGGGAMAIGLGPDIGIPLAVGLSVLSAFGLGFGHGYTAAAFTALFVQAVPFGGPLETLGVRFLAVGTATVSAFAVNVLLSAAAYRSIFRRRVRFAEATVSSLLVRAVEEGPTVVQAGFPMVVALEAELASALGELRLRRSRETAAWLAGLAEHVASLRRLLHLVFELSYRLEEEGLPKGAMKPWLNWLVHAGGQEPEVHAALAVTTRRIRELGKTLRPQGDKRGATRRPK